MRTRPPLLVSAGIILRDGQVLVGQRRKADRHALKWEFPGGKVEAGETPQRALVRELREELNIEAEVGPQLARYEHDYPNGSRVHLLFFSVHKFEGELKGMVFEQIRWTPLASLPELDFLEGDWDFIRRLTEGEFDQQLNFPGLS
jgi:8-oxo-dGTP diphosphatase